MCTDVLVVFESTKVVSTVPVAFIWPVQAIVALMPSDLIEMFVILQSPRGGFEYGLPYLSIIACVTHTCVVCGAKGDAGIVTPGGNCVPGGSCGICGMPAMFICVVTSQRPAFRCDWLHASAVSATPQQPTIVQTRLLFIHPPRRAGECSALFDSTPTPLGLKRVSY
jgi:hypothetical protein